jgi:hypothetical protein
MSPALITLSGAGILFNRDSSLPRADACRIPSTLLPPARFEVESVQSGAGERIKGEWQRRRGDVTRRSLCCRFRSRHDRRSRSPRGRMPARRRDQTDSLCIQRPPADDLLAADTQKSGGAPGCGRIRIHRELICVPQIFRLREERSSAQGSCRRSCRGRSPAPITSRLARSSRGGSRLHWNGTRTFEMGAVFLGHVGDDASAGGDVLSSILGSSSASDSCDPTSSACAIAAAASCCLSFSDTGIRSTSPRLTSSSHAPARCRESRARSGRN